MKQSAIVICALLMLFCGNASSSPSRSPDTHPAWLLGYWHVTYDEDGDPPDWTEFKANGQFMVISPECNVGVGHYHVFDGDVYLTFIIPGKGPVALVYRPSPDKAHLTYTSLRTRHNATLRKVRAIPCKLNKAGLK